MQNVVSSDLLLQVRHGGTVLLRIHLFLCKQRGMSCLFRYMFFKKNKTLTLLTPSIINIDINTYMLMHVWFRIHLNLYKFPERVVRTDINSLMNDWSQSGLWILLYFLTDGTCKCLLFWSFLLPFPQKQAPSRWGASVTHRPPYRIPLGRRYSLSTSVHGGGWHWGDEQEKRQHSC